MRGWKKRDFSQPRASTKYHGAYAGGLVEHTNHVYRRLVRLADEEDKRQGRTYPEYTVDTIAVAALLHDVCKVDAYKVEKKNQKQKDGSWKEVEVYGYTNSLPLGLVKVNYPDYAIYAAYGRRNAGYQMAHGRF